MLSLIGDDWAWRGQLTATAQALNVDQEKVFALATEWARTDDLASRHRPEEGRDYHAEYLQSLADRTKPKIEIHVRLFIVTTMGLKVDLDRARCTPQINSGFPPFDGAPGLRTQPAAG